VKVLVRAKAHIETIDHYGRTALDRARVLLSTSIKTLYTLQRAAEWAQKSRNPPSWLIASETQ
jgi:hypothetical protein